MTTSKAGYLGKVTIGTNKILGIGQWQITGGTADELDDTELGDEEEKIVLGMGRGGAVSFSGNHKPGDTTGQIALIQAYKNRTELTDLRFWIDETSYYMPCQTAGYLHPSVTTGGGTVVSNVLIKQAMSISYDKGSLGSTSFEGRVNGDMVLV
jgi:hypothetical protein